MVNTRGFICTTLFHLFVVWSTFLSAQTTISGTTQNPDNQDSISAQIRAYENVVSELQHQPANKGSLANILTKLGDLYSASENYPQAINLYSRAIELKQSDFIFKNSKETSIAWQMIEIGNSFYRLHDYKLAEDAFKKASDYFESVNDQKGVITAINNIGLCRLKDGKPKEAYDRFVQMLQLAKKINDQSRIYSSTTYIGISLAALGRYDEAIKTLNEKQPALSFTDEAELHCFRLLQLGEIYMGKGDTLAAIELFKQMSTKHINEATTFYAALANQKLAIHYAGMNNTSLAIAYAEEACQLLKKEHHLRQLTEINGLLYELYKKTGNKDKALFYFEAFHDGTIQLNNSEVETFVSDYNKKMEQLAIQKELQFTREQSDRLLIEKMNQKSLSVFLIVIALLLLIMMFTSKGFDARVEMLLEHINSYSRQQKWLLMIVLGLYFMFFYYFFVPIENAVGLRSLSFFQRLTPGLVAFTVVSVLGLVFFSPRVMQKKVKNWYIYSIYVFFLAFFSVLLAEFIHFNIIGFGGFNYLLSLSLIVLASFIVPLYLFILVVEKLVIRHVEAISQSLNQYITEMKQKPGPTKKTITLQSEKTSGRLSFDISELMSVEAQGNYSMFVLYQNKTVSRKILHITMKAIEESLSEYEFVVRCHKSYMVNILYISKITGNSRGYLFHFDKETDPVPVSRNFQKNVMEVLRKFKDGF